MTLVAVNEKKKNEEEEKQKVWGEGEENFGTQ
jgi:hypothetical protein